MAACGSLSSLMETPLPPESGRTFFESLSSWSRMNHRTKPIDDACCGGGGRLTEIFGELNFDEQTVENKGVRNGGTERTSEHSNNRFGAAKNSESLQLCTEGLGSESSDDLDDFVESGSGWDGECKEKPVSSSRSRSECPNATDGKNSRRSWNFPPPISSIGKGGRPLICLRSYRHDGRFVLKEFWIPTQEVLRSSREGGRLKLHFVQPEEIISEEEEDEEEKKAEEGEAEVEDEVERENALGI